MPNWCHNTLKVTGPKEKLEAFIEQAKTDEQPLSFGALVPEPEGLLDREMNTHENVLPADALAATEGDVRLRTKVMYAMMETLPEERLDWYHWRWLKWGTKWDANFEALTSAVSEVPEAQLSHGAGLVNSGDEALYSFLTAYSPPEPFCVGASKLFPELSFELTYAEPGSGGAGRFAIKDGESTYTSLEVDDVLALEDQWY